MNYINNGEYYLVAKYKGEEPDIIKINQNWYLRDKKEDNYLSRNDISAIDIVTSKFENEEQMKDQMYKNGYLKSKDVDIYIIHKNKHNGKEYINEYEIIYNNKHKEKRSDLLNHMANRRLYNDYLDTSLTDNLMNKFLTKCKSSLSFKEFMTSPFSTIDKYLIETILKKQVPDYSIKYLLKDKINTYPFIRNIISMWNIYDELYEKNKELVGKELSDKIIKDYIEILDSRNSRRLDYQKLSEKVDKNNVEGQITLDEYFGLTENYEQQLENIYNEEKSLMNSPYDDKYLGSLVEQFGIEGAFAKITTKDIVKMSLEDKFRMGLISDYIEYKRLKRNNGKRYS